MREPLAGVMPGVYFFMIRHIITLIIAGTLMLNGAGQGLALSSVEGYALRPMALVKTKAIDAELETRLCVFVCENCGMKVPELKGGYRDHCPNCLWSIHLDDEKPGDRASECHGMMMPIGLRHNPKKGWQIQYECAQCGVIKVNKSAQDDNWTEMIELSQQQVALKASSAGKDTPPRTEKTLRLDSPLRTDIVSIRPWALIDTRNFEGDAFRDLRRELALFKMGDQSVINDYANQMTHLIKSRLGQKDLKEWILFHWRVKNMPFPHACFFLMDAISKNLGIEVQYVDIDPIIFIIYPRLSAANREQMIGERAAGFEISGISGKKVIILDDVFCTGAVLSGMRTVAISSNTREIESFVMFDANGDLSFESDLYDIFVHEKRDQVIALLNGESKLTDTLIKYLMRFAAQSPGDFKIFIDQVRPSRVEELVQAIEAFKRVSVQDHGIYFNPFLQIAANMEAVHKSTSLSTRIGQNPAILTTIDTAA